MAWFSFLQDSFPPGCMWRRCQPRRVLLFGKKIKLLKYKVLNCHQLACASGKKVEAKRLVPRPTLPPVWIVLYVLKRVCVCVRAHMCVPSPTWEQILAAFLRIYPCKGGPSPRTPRHLLSEAGGGIILSKWNSRSFPSPKQTILRNAQVEESLGAVGVLPCEIMMCFIPAYKRENASSGRTHNCMTCIWSEISTRNTQAPEIKRELWGLCVARRAFHIRASSQCVQCSSAFSSLRFVCI